MMFFLWQSHQSIPLERESESEREKSEFMKEKGRRERSEIFGRLGGRSGGEADS
jgi:hypothetical protein